MIFRVTRVCSASCDENAWPGSKNLSSLIILLTFEARKSKARLISSTIRQELSSYRQFSCSSFFYLFFFSFRKEPSSLLSRSVYVRVCHFRARVIRNKQLFSESVPRTINRTVYTSFQIKQTLEQNQHLVRLILARSSLFI